MAENNKVFAAPVGSAACRRVSGTCDQCFVAAMPAAAAAAAGEVSAEPLGEPTREILV